MSLISEAMRGAAGREIRRTVSFPVTDSDIRRWAVAVYYPETPPARFWDEQAARASRYGGIVAPEDFNPFAWMAATPPPRPDVDPSVDADWTEHILDIDGPGLKNQLNGGLEVEYGEPIRPGDVIAAAETLAGYSEKTGRLGDMLFTVLAEVWTNQRAELVRTSRFTLIRY